MQTYVPERPGTMFINTNIADLSYKGGGKYSALPTAKAVVTGDVPIQFPTPETLYSKLWAQKYEDATPPKTYAFYWSNVISNIQEVVASFDLLTARKPAGDYLCCNSIFDVYVDYIEQGTGASKSVFCKQYDFEFGIQMYFDEFSMPGPVTYPLEEVILNLRCVLPSLATQVRFRIEAKNGSRTDYMYEDEGGCVDEYVTFLGCTIYTKENIQKEVSFSGTIHTLSVGR